MTSSAFEHRTARRRRITALTLGALVAATGLSLASPAPALATGRPCASPVLAHDQRAAEVRRTNPSAYRAAARANAGDPGFADATSDPTFWLDTCGQGYFVEETAPEVAGAKGGKPGNGGGKGGGGSTGGGGGSTGGGGGSTGGTGATDTPVTATVPLADTFTLQSRPGSNRTIYLDFTGDTVTGTAWNNNYGTSITATPYSKDSAVDTNFSDAELTDIQRVWQEVAEDYAPFDVNVTLADPGVDAINRSGSTDLVYGTRVIITSAGYTATGSMQSSCGCGGIAYVNVFNNSSNHLYYQPAWVFTDGVGTGYKYIGEAVSHEAGHNFGLHHDGTATSGYYTGSAPWAPIMGASYYQPVSQWSIGEYPGANNTEDDLAIIATGAPRVADDHGDTAATATALGNGEVRNGLIGTRADVDAFSFTAAGATTVQITPGPGLPDLDVQLRITDAQGSTVALIDPAVAKVSNGTATGLDAAWSVTLPSTAAAYTAYVDGVGHGDPGTAGGYSDYASLGYYQIALSTQTGSTANPPTVTAAGVPTGTVGSPYTADPVSVTGGTSPYSYAATGLPAGLSIDAATGTVSGTPTTAGTSTATITVTDAASATGSAQVTFQIVSGTPTKKGKSSFTFTVTDSTGARVSQTFSIQVR